MKKINLIHITNALINRFLRLWRRMEFEEITGCKTNNLNIIGKIYCRNPNVKIGKNVTFYPGVMLQGTGYIYIGDNTYIENNTNIYSEEGYKIIISENCMIAGQCYIINADHKIKLGKNINQQGTYSSDIQIDENVWIGANVTILKGCHVKRGSVIGAKALLVGNTETEINSIYVGAPAKLLKIRK